MKKVEAGVKMFEMDRVLPQTGRRRVWGSLCCRSIVTVRMDIKMGCCKEGWQIVLAGSRFLRQNEKNLCPGEVEGLVVVYALEKTKHFVLGCKHLYMATDHKPLLGTFKDRNLEQVENPRLRRLKEKTKMLTLR